jgi:gentisate 1,2-dioxygenase
MPAGHHRWEGSYSVNGQKIRWKLAMVLTPGWCWHGHDMTATSRLIGLMGLMYRYAAPRTNVL